MINTKIFNTQDLVLKVSNSYDPNKLKLHEWDRFLDKISQNRPYQKEAVKAAILFLASGKYKNIEDLIKDNARHNTEIGSRYHTVQDYLKKLQMPSKLAATIDLATGSGKSFVIYAIAQIALGIGLVEKVLVLTPSVTIREELSKKFRLLSEDSNLLGTIPLTSHARNPRIINANDTIKPNDICITNIHAAYLDSKSSIMDSVGFLQGQTCLVLSDEVHHVYNRIEGRDEESQGIKKWKEFIQNDAYGFKYHVGFTGTAYMENEYFNDVIYRFSLRQAIEEGYVKSVEYVHEDETHKGKENEKFQKIYQNHQRNKDIYSELRPLTILVTADIKEAKKLNTRLVEFLSTRPHEGTEEYISKNKVLLVTSDNDHKANLLRLPYVDSADETIEWIISVAMLTEGWDVKNVYQIVPMEEKAFNSKLLIAQVLGRGLRLPINYPQSLVTVFNHANWASKIASLVNEILEIEMRLKNSTITNTERAIHHFSLHNFRYDKKPITTSNPTSTVFNYKDKINLASENFEHDSETKYVNINGLLKPITYKIEKERFSVSTIVNEIVRKFEDLDWEGKTLNLQEHQYTQNNLPPKNELEAYIRGSMESVGIIGDYVGKDNYIAILSTFNTLLRQASKSIVYKKVINEPFEILTKNRESESVSILSLRQSTTVYYTEDFESEIVYEDTITNLRAFLEDTSRPVKALQQISNSYLLKTPLDLVFVSHEPERKFVDSLIKREIVQHIDAWIKSTNQNFYSIEYSVTKGSHTSQHSFNPDFFILIKKEVKEYIIVVETKDDGDNSEENKAKFKYAEDHFKELNLRLRENNINQEYIFHFLSPCNYSDFFTYLKDGRLIQRRFRSELENNLLNKNQE